MIFISFLTILCKNLPYNGVVVKNLSKRKKEERDAVKQLAAGWVADNPMSVLDRI
jgi:hypothetical protein